MVVFIAVISNNNQNPIHISASGMQLVM